MDDKLYRLTQEFKNHISNINIKITDIDKIKLSDKNKDLYKPAIYAIGHILDNNYHLSSQYPDYHNIIKRAEYIDNNKNIRYIELYLKNWIQPQVLTRIYGVDVIPSEDNLIIAEYYVGYLTHI
jgi:hypothetical protein